MKKRAAGGMCVGFAVVLLLASASVQAQNVYKCEQGGVTTFSQQPCDSSAAVIILDRGQPYRAEQSSNVREIGLMADRRSAQLEYERCARVSEQAVMAPASRVIAQHRGQISRLQRAAAGAGTNLAGATYELGLRNEIASLNLAISDAQWQAQQLAQQHMDVCLMQRDRRLDAIDSLAGRQ